MARIRTIKPAFFSSLSNAELPKATRLTWIGLWTYVDDKGRGVDDARLIKAAIWPLDDDYTVRKVEADLEMLDRAGKIGRYEVDGKRYFAVRRWEHQRINRPQPSCLPAAPWEEGSLNPPVASTDAAVNTHGARGDDSLSAHGTVRAPALNTHGRKGREGNKEGKGVGREGKMHSSSSNHLVVGAESDDDDEQPETDKAAAAVALIAERRFEAKAATGAEILNPGGYRQSVRMSVADELGAQIETLLRKGLEPVAVADRLQPVPTDASPYPEWKPDEPGEPVAPASPERLAELRKALA